MIDPAVITACLSAIILVLYRYRTELAAVVRAISYAWRNPEEFNGKGDAQRTVQ